MKTPKIKFEFACVHSYPYRDDRGHTDASVRVRLEYKETTSFCPRSEVAEVASRRFGWSPLVGPDEATEEAGKWAIEGIAEVLKKLWPESTK